MRAYANVSTGQAHYAIEGSGPPVILLHHAGASHREFENVIPALSTRYQVFALDLPGHGGSDPLPGPISMQRYADHVAEFMDQMAIQAAHIIGIHTGAEIAVKLAESHPQRVCSIVIYGVLCRDTESLDALLPPEVLQVPPFDDRGQYLLEAWNFQRLFVQNDTPASRIHRLVVEHLNSWASEPLAHRACYEQNAYSKTDLPNVQCPALVISGSRDPLQKDSDAVARLIPNCRHVTIDGADVHVALDHGPTYTSEIMDFLEPLCG